MQKDMGWFFKQWIYGTDLPKYKFSYKLGKTPEDKYLVHCKIEQEDVTDDFQMNVPLYIDFGDHRFARKRIFVKGPVTEITLPLMPIKPQKIIFNDLESVLCEVKQTKWMD